jgi:hypothetical protein
VPTGLIIAGASVPLIRRVTATIADPGSGRATHLWAALAVVLTFTLMGWTATRLGQHVLTEHDPGVYANTARLLSDHGSLRLPVGSEADEHLIATLDQAAIDLTGPGAYAAGSDHLEFQFSHGPSVIMSIGYDLVGWRGLFVAPVVVGAVALLALYLLATQLVGSGVLAVAALTATGLSAPFVYVTRSTYSEPFALAVIVTGLAVMARRGPIPVVRAGAIGLCIGAAMLYRIDGMLAVAGLVAAGCAAALSGTTGRALGTGLLAAAVPVAIGLTDLVWFSGDYWSSQESYAPALAALVGAGVVVAWLLVRHRGSSFVTKLRETWLPTSAVPVAAIVATATVLAWLVRPRVSQPTNPWPPGDPRYQLIETFQIAAGLAPDGSRSYAEYTLASLGWYLGPVTLALAVAGFAILTVRACRRPGSRAGAVVAFWLVTVPPLLVDWQIMPYQLWASRRLVPFVLPAVVIAAVVGAEALLRLLTRSERLRRGSASRWVVLGGAGLVAVLIIVPTTRTTWPVRDQAEQRGYLAGLLAACDELDDATTLSVAGRAFNVPLRAWCGVPTAAVGPASPAGTDVVSDFVDAAIATCTPAAIVVGPEDSGALQGVGTARSFSLVNPRQAIFTFDRPPDAYVTQRHDFTVARVQLPSSCQGS